MILDQQQVTSDDVLDFPDFVFAAPPKMVQQVTEIIRATSAGSSVQIIGSVTENPFD